MQALRSKPWAALALFVSPLAGAAQAQDSPTVPGPESTQLLAGVHGWIVMAQPLGGLVAVSLPHGGEIVVRSAGDTIGTVHSLSGPDRAGRVAFVENHMLEKRHDLKWISLDGAEGLITERPGDALWDWYEIGEHLALAPTGGHVAFVEDITMVQGGGGGIFPALVKQGRLSIWSVDEPHPLPVHATALDESLCWFPDGRHLAYVDLLESAEAVKLLLKHVPPGEEFGSEWDGWIQIPVVCLLDTQTGEHRPVHVGEDAVVSPDGRELLVRDSVQRWRLFDLECDTSTSVEVPGLIHPGAIAFVAQGRVLYWSWPTEGAKLGVTDNNSPLVEPKPLLALKILELSSGGFQTVPGLDPRGTVSYGAAGP
jgi:hypothetical protein